MATYIRSVDGKVQVEIEPGSPATLLPNISDQGLQAQIDALRTEIRTYRGQPVVVTDSADMDNELTIYLYMGSEEGFNADHWYYYDGTEWVDGGEYVANPVLVDDTLTQSGEAADAKVTGDEITAIKADLTELDEELELTPIPIDKTSTTINYKYKYGTGNTWDSTVQICLFDVEGYSKLSITTDNTYGNETNLFPNIVFFSGTPSPETEVSAIYYGNIAEVGWHTSVDVPAGATKMYVIVKKGNTSLSVGCPVRVKDQVLQNEDDIDAVESRMTYNVTNIGYAQLESNSPFKKEITITPGDIENKRISGEFIAWSATSDYHIVYCGMWVKLTKGTKVCICGRRYVPQSVFLDLKGDGSLRLWGETNMQKNAIAVMDVPDDTWTYVYGATVLGGYGPNATENKVAITAVYPADDASESYTMALKNGVFIDLTATFGAGCEPTAEGMKLLLSGATDYYFQTTYNIFNSPIMQGVFQRTRELESRHLISPEIYADDENQIHINGIVSEGWSGWNTQRTYGLHKSDTPVPISMHGVLENDSMLSVIPLYGAWSKYGDYPEGAIWGGHLAHFWNNAMTYRLTFMTSSDKIGEGESQAVENEYCIFAWSPNTFYENPVYPLTEDQLSHRATRDVEDRFNAGAYYGQIRIGADVNTKGFLFRAKSLKCFGKIDMNGNDILIRTNPTETSGATGEPGSIRYGENYLYICVAENTWKRVPLESF